jgi:hypothetical protein
LAVSPRRQVAFYIAGSLSFMAALAILWWMQSKELI